MANAPLSREDAQQALDEKTRHGSAEAAARALGIKRNTFSNRLQAAKIYGLKPSAAIFDKDNPAHLRDRIRDLERELKSASTAQMDAEAIRTKIVQLKKAVDAAEPEWTARPLTRADAPGVPTLFLSDFHWGEVVKAPQIMRKNEFNLAIAHQRLEQCVETAIHLCRILSPKMEFPGIVVPLGGDMVSGNIHDELQATNELNTMPTVVDLYGALVAAIERLRDAFGHVFLPCVTGNHGRDTHKTWAKDRTHTSFDWLLYCFLAKRFEGDKRVQFLIPDGPDAYYRVYGTRYLLTHGDQFRGGDGMIGALGPIIRGDHKKRSRNAQIDAEYDVMLCGHWHQLIQLNRLIVNGSLKGYDEYAFAGNFPFERPQQALWITHPKHGLTYRMPVHVDRRRDVERTAWVSVAA